MHDLYVVAIISSLVEGPKFCHLGQPYYHHDKISEASCSGMLPPEWSPSSRPRRRAFIYVLIYYVG